MKVNKGLKIALIIIGVIFLAVLIVAGYVFFTNRSSEQPSMVTVTFLGENDEVLKTEEILKGTTVEQWDPYSTEGFIGWFTDNNEVFDFNTEIQNDLTLRAKWSTVEDITTHLVTFLVDDEFYQSLLVPENETAPEPEAPLKEGYTFVGWYENDTLFDFNTPITSSHTLVARFQ